MSLIDEIRENAKSGTPGPWNRDDNSILTSRKESYVALCIRFGTRDAFEASENARRIAAVPRMETALLAAEQIAESFAARLDGEGGTPHEYAALAAFREACK